MSSRIAYLGDRHALLATVRDLIAAADEAIVLQMYLFAANGDQTLLLPRPGAFPYAHTVARWLEAKRRARPDVPIVVLLDSNTPANRMLTRRRGTLVREDLTRAGCVVLNACLWQTTFDRRRRLLPRMNFHLDHGGVAHADWVERQNRWQALHNVEDHRKNLVIDGGRAGAITSHNFFDPAWDWHENMFVLGGDAAQALWRSATSAIRDALAIPQALDREGDAMLDRLLAVAARARPPAPHDPAPVEGYPLPAPPAVREVTAPVRLVEHAAIRERLVALFDGAGPGDDVLVATTYFSDVELLETIAAAARRGARVRVLVDSIHALPLPPVPAWLTRNLLNHSVLHASSQIATRGFELRVHDSRAGAMMHLKTAARLGARPLLIGGQANFTPNSFSGAWLETDIETASPDIASAFAAHFDQLWSLRDSRPLEPASAARERTLTMLVRLFERAGLRG